MRVASLVLAALLVVMLPPASAVDVTHDEVTLTLGINSENNETIPENITVSTVEPDTTTLEAPIGAYVAFCGLSVLGVGLSWIWFGRLRK